MPSKHASHTNLLFLEVWDNVQTPAFFLQQEFPLGGGNIQWEGLSSMGLTVDVTVIRIEHITNEKLLPSVFW